VTRGTPQLGGHIEGLERNKKAVLAFYDIMFHQCDPR
jgi:hypothetical protein